MMTGHTVNDVLAAMKPGGLQLLPEQEFVCRKHGSYRGKPVVSSLTGTEPVPPSCPRCRKEEAAEQIRQWERKTRLVKMNIGPRYYDACFENFDAYTPELKQYLGIAKRFAQNPQGKLIMLGNNGTGKNHLAVSILKQIGSGAIYTVKAVSDMLRKTYGKEYAGESDSEMLERLSRLDLLVLDEIGRSKGSAWELDWLSYLINARHERMLPAVLISNGHFKPDCLKGGCDMCLSNYLGQDVLSRLLEDGIVMEFTGNDYREIKGAAFIKGLGQQD